MLNMDQIYALRNGAFFFCDEKNPGTVWVGNEEQMRNLKKNGGTPYKVDDPLVIKDGTRWKIESAD